MKANRKFNIIYRACDGVNAVNNNPRPYNLTKAQLIKICFLGLIESLKGIDFRILVLGDKLSEEMKLFFSHFNVELYLGNFGNDASIREALRLAKTIPDNEWIYFCEDDYLHTSSSFSQIETFLNERSDLLKQKKKIYNLSSFINLNKKDIFIFPPDYPDRYKPKFRKHSLIVLSSGCHWRQVTNVTFTFLTKASTIKKRFPVLMKSSNGANDIWLSKKLFGSGFGFWAQSICFSPLPGLSSHMHRDTMTPLVDWELLVQHYTHKLSELKY